MLGDYTWDVVEKESESLAKRFNAVTKNIANANTPGYARRNVSFEDQMREVMEQDKKLHMTVTDPQHIPSHPLKIKDVHAAEIKIMDEQYRLDLNNVDPEREMAVLAETRMMYTGFMRIASSKLTMLKSVIAGR
ncbi:MAG: flagellar basal body rod protein FlgB [Synergistaceae bacterium]|nr:flagellar basal body rod protein FlgB [Synergistaceae bacterium]MBQ6435633.1 flagellar basal body rod protein FlgB [Synergistaceae bacterium]MBQ6738932.1 flagellar basal body rod protein FlgB [Synergistaceae bacterium]MBQ7068794.1 flagellar basal body rod protein FlgB [Synergistaceae bacterium]MBR0074203.1 flagellar basal body rod protein FlgB [Synergistaceae bacterium]